MEGAPHTAKTTVNLCVLGCPLPPYIKEWRRGGPASYGAPQGRIPTPTRSRFPPFPSPTRRGRKEEGERRKEGPPPPPLVQFGLGGRHLLGGPLSSEAHGGPLTSRGGSGNPPALRFYPKLSGTLPVSEQHGPIYQSLCLDYFETPRHVRDLIRDSEQPSVHQVT